MAARCHSPATGALLEVRRSSSQGLESRVHVDAGGAWSHERFDPRVSTAPTAVTHGCLSPDSATRLETALAQATWRAFPLDHACAEVFHLVTQYVVHGAVRWATDACRLRLDVTSAHALAVIDDELRSVVQR